MTSEKKKRSNQRNSQLSTGPRDTRKTRYNALTHGITSKEAVIPSVDGEDAAEIYEDLRAGLREEYQTGGILEEILVDQIALGFQQSKRLSKYESSLIEWKTRRFLEKRASETRVDRYVIDFGFISGALERLQESGDLEPLVDFNYLLAFAQERLGASTNELDNIVGDPIRTMCFGELQQSTYSPEKLSKLFKFALKRGNFSENELRFALKDYLGNLIAELEAKAKQLDEETGLLLALNAIPDGDELNRILKYEARASSRFYKGLNQLQKMQSDRGIDGSPSPGAHHVLAEVGVASRPARKPERRLEQAEKVEIGPMGEQDNLPENMIDSSSTIRQDEPSPITTTPSQPEDPRLATGPPETASGVAGEQTSDT